LCAESDGGGGGTDNDRSPIFQERTKDEDDEKEKWEEDVVEPVIKREGGRGKKHDKNKEKKHQAS